MTQRLMVLRPDDPAPAIAAATKETLLPEEFQRVIHSQPYRLVGFSRLDGSHDIVDESGNVIDQLKPGDSFARICRSLLCTF